MEYTDIWTIGHSTREFQDYLAMLHSFKVKLVVDIRSYPGSRRYPQFNKDSLEKTLPENKIDYVHLKELGGRRKANPDSRNLAWRHPAFRGYADYMETEVFREAAQQLISMAKNKRTAYMCSEAVWWRCHRSLVSDYLKSQGWEVIHIMDIGKGEIHPFTSPAKIIEGKLSYGNG